MKAPKLFYYISGSLTLVADGPFCERLLNICMHRGMPIWDIKHMGKNRVVFKTTISSFLKIRKPARRTKSHIRILKRQGLPFILRRYRKRKLLIIALVPVLVFFWYSSTHIMGITVFGNNRIDTQTILSKLSECGISIGAKTSSINPDRVRNNMMLKIDELAWIGVNAGGSRVYIEVIERIEKDKGVEKDGIACNLIAKKDGEIMRLEIREGKALVKTGSGVLKGDVLVSGIIDEANSELYYVKARGVVLAKTKTKLSRIFEIENSNPKETADKKAQELFLEMTNDILPDCQILEKNYSYSINEHYKIEVVAEIICCENIAEEAVIEKAVS